MNRRDAVFALVALSAGPLSAKAQQPRKIWRIGFLLAGNRPPNGLAPAPFREGLAALGYQEGTNVAFDGRWSEMKFERLPELAAELVQHRVDVILVVGWATADAAKRATATIPIVTVSIGDAVECGLAASLARPGGNLTGLTDVEAELSAKRLQLLKESVPKASRIAVMWNKDDVSMSLRYRRIDSAARALAVKVQALGVREPDDFDAAFSAMTRERPDAIFLVSDALTSLNRKRIIEFAAANRIPAMYEFSSYAEDGGLMSYGSNFIENLRRAAYFVDRIFKGANPGEMPMEQPTKYELVVNLKTAKALGIAIPPSVLVRADRIIE